MKIQKILNFGEPDVDFILRRRLENEGFKISQKTRLGDVINKEDGEWLSDAEFRCLSRAHLDFVITKDYIPVFAVEFDGSRHFSDPKTIERDVLKNRLCKMAGLPLLRITTQEICKADEITLLDYMLLRYVAWKKEYKEIMSEIKKYAADLPENIDPEQLATDLDPNFHFNIRHPFPGIQVVQERLWKRYQIAWRFSRENRKNIASYICNIEAVETHLGHNQFDRCIVRAKVWKNGNAEKNAIYSTKCSASIRSWLPLKQKVPDWSEIGPLLNNGDQRAVILFENRVESMWMADLPGINAWDIAQNYAEYLGFRAIEKWAENQFKVNYWSK